MELQHRFDDGKSQTCSHNLTLVVLGAVVFVENKLYLVLLDALTRVLNFNENAVRLVYLADENLLVIACVVYGVVDKVVDDLLYLHHIAAHRSFLVGSELDGVALFLGYSCKPVDYLAEL